MQSQNSSLLVNNGDNSNLIALIKNYEMFERVREKTELEIYLGELKIKLNKLLIKKKASSLIQEPLFFKFFNIIPSKFFIDEIDDKILNLESELKEANLLNKNYEEIRNRIISLFKILVIENDEFQQNQEIESLNALIQKNIFFVWDKSINYQLQILNSRIKSGVNFLAHMSDSRIKYEKLNQKFKKINEEIDRETKLENYETIYHDLLDCINETDIIIEYSKINGIFKFLEIILAVIGIILAIVMYYHWI